MTLTDTIRALVAEHGLGAVHAALDDATPLELPPDTLDTRRLGQAAGSILVTRAAALQVAETQHGDQADHRVEEARRYLTEHGCGAKHRGTSDGVQQWRARSRSTGADVSLWLTIEGPLAVVVRATARPTGGSNPSRRRRIVG